jgi:hypothetical protein
MNNIGCAQKNLQEYTKALQILDIGLEKTMQYNAQIEKTIQAESKSQTLTNSGIQDKIAVSEDNIALIRRMQFHKVGCLKGLKREKESETLARQLWKEGIETKDTRLLEDLKKDGYDFGGN